MVGVWINGSTGHPGFLLRLLKGGIQAVSFCAVHTKACTALVPGVQKRFLGVFAILSRMSVNFLL